MNKEKTKQKLSVHFRNLKYSLAASDLREINFLEFSLGTLLVFSGGSRKVSLVENVNDLKKPSMKNSHQTGARRLDRIQLWPVFVVSGKQDCSTKGAHVPVERV